MDNMAFQRSEEMIKILSTLAGMQEQVLYMIWCCIFVDLILKLIDFWINAH